jgi:hypothetical protein
MRSLFPSSAIWTRLFTLCPTAQFPAFLPFYFANPLAEQFQLQNPLAQQTTNLRILKHPHAALLRSL